MVGLIGFVPRVGGIVPISYNMSFNNIKLSGTWELLMCKYGRKIMVIGERILTPNNRQGD